MAKNIKYTPAELAEINKLLIEQAKLQSQVSNSVEDYIAGLEKAKKINKTLNNNKRIEADLDEEQRAAVAAGDINAAKAATFRLNIIKKQNANLKSQLDILGASLKAVNKANLIGMKFTVGLLKGFTKLPDLVQNSFGQIKKLGVFEMDKAIRMSALQMGILGKSTDTFREDIKSAALDTLQMGVGIEELTKIQSEYTDNLGRNVMLNQEGLKAMAQMAVVTGLGADGTAKMAADLENQGLSAERTQQIMKETLDDTTKLGLNASKIFKNIASSTKMLNKYNFKDGTKGLIDMAKIVTKLGVGMEFASGMADKLFDIEGAVDMSAQLQVMGGAWAKLADPFHLMYMARNDMAGLTEEIGNAAESSAHFNSKTKEFEISALEMHRLRVVAQQTGTSYEELAQAGKNAAKFTKIKSQLSFTMDKDEKEFLINTAKLDENGKAYIVVDGSPKFLNQLTTADKKMLGDQILEKKTMKERAEASQTFDEALTNTTNMFKVAMLPIIEGMNKDLMPKLKAFVDKFIKNKWADKIGYWADKIGSLASTVGGWIIDNPILAGVTYLSSKIGGWFFEKASWILNGISLAEGFNIGVSGGGFMQGLKSMFGMGGQGPSSPVTPGSPGPRKGPSGFGRAGAAMAGTGLGMGAGSLISSATGQESTMTGDITSALAGAGGWGLAAALAPESFGASLLIPLIASAAGKYFGDMASQPVHDGIIGGDFSNGRGIIQGGKITPIDNKDDLIAMKPKGAVANAIQSNTPSNMKIDFGEIHFKFDELKVSSPGSPGVAIDLLKNPQFIRDITKMVHVETEKAIQGGKSKG
jgi:hypothetical protein